MRAASRRFRHTGSLPVRTASRRTRKQLPAYDAHRQPDYGKRRHRLEQFAVAQQPGQIPAQPKRDLALGSALASQADTAAASGSMTDEFTSQMKNGVKNAMSGVGHWLLTSFGLAPQVKPSVASNASQGGAAPAAVGDKRSLPSDGEDAIALLPPDNPNKSAPRPTLLPDADPVDRSVSLSSQPPINASEALRDEPAPEKTKPSSARAASASENRAEAMKKKSDEREASTHAERKSYKSGAKGASKSRHSSATVARSERTDEIGRLKSQAFSETTSDRIKDRKSKQRPPLSDYIFLPQSSSEKEGTPARIGKATNVKEALGQCQHRSNFFRREYCKWQVCDGSWGKYGCPSFENKTASYKRRA